MGWRPRAGVHACKRLNDSNIYVDERGEGVSKQGCSHPNGRQLSSTANHPYVLRVKESKAMSEALALSALCARRDRHSVSQPAHHSALELTLMDPRQILDGCGERGELLCEY